MDDRALSGLLGVVEMSRLIAVYVDPDDVLDKIPTEVLVAELEARRALPPSNDHRNYEIAEAVKSGDMTHLRVVLERYMPGIGEMM